MISGLKQSKGKQFQVDTVPEELLLAVTQRKGYFDLVFQTFDGVDAEIISEKSQSKLSKNS